jgi:selenide, water dikinase
MENHKKLTAYSKGSGCGCKIQPAVLGDLLEGLRTDGLKYPKIIVGNQHSDDASVYDLGNGTYLLQTVDFFTPMVDDPYIFGQVAAANAVSDIYAMGGTPIMANALLGWPLDVLDSALAKSVLKGGRDLCDSIHLPLVGGHSIESAEPIYGLSVTGLVLKDRLRTNAMAQVGDVIALTKPLGVGMLAAATKRGIANELQINALHRSLMEVNTIGSYLSEISGVHAMTDVTGFGLLGHLLEILKSSGVGARISGSDIPKIEEAQLLASQFMLPDNAMRNWNAFESHVHLEHQEAFPWLVDPQTNGGLLFTFSEGSRGEIEKLMCDQNQEFWVIGRTELWDSESPIRVRVI